MYFDSLTLAAVADDLRESILGGRIQRALLPSDLSVGLEIYAAGRRFHLLLSAHPQFTRAHLSSAKLSRGVERDTPLLLLLRKYIVGGRIVAIEQPELERVLVLSIVKGSQARNTPADDEDAPPEEEAGDEPFFDEETAWHTELVVETQERRGNVILVGDDNIILESVRHISPR
ncbi:fibronectin-binding protein, partial [Kouleothrix aurantiaca]